MNVTPCSRAKLTFHLPPLVLHRSPQHSAALESQTSSSQDTLYSLAESISAHLSSLGDALHGIVPSNADGEEVRNIKKSCVLHIVRNYVLTPLVSFQLLRRNLTAWRKPQHRTIVPQRSAKGTPSNVTLHRTKSIPCLCCFALNKPAPTSPS